ncbi:MAG: type II secretion system F family protein [Rhodomicrobium sp.]
MAEFTYKALDSNGAFVTGKLQAQSLSAAARQLVELGYTPLSTGPDTAESGNFLASLVPRSAVSKHDVTVLLQDLALLLRSGLPLDEGLKLLMQDAGLATGRLIAQLRTTISGGASFAEALQSHPATALPELIAIVRSAEATGNLENALEAIAQERVKQEKISTQIYGALRYPLFLMAVSIAVLLFFLLFVVPQFADVIRDFGTPPGSLVTAVIALSDGLRGNGDIIAGLVAAFSVAIVIALRVKSIRKIILAAVLQMPGLHGVLTLRRVAVFCRGLGTMLSSGVVLTDAMRLMSESSMAGDKISVLCDRVRRGGRLFDAISETNFLPPLAARMLRVGEESGALDTVSIRCANYYEAKLTERIDKLTSIVGPAAIVFIATIIGTLIVSIMTTLLSINQIIS